MKNTKSYRIMPIPNALICKLKQAQIKQKENRLLFGKSYNSEFLDYVCVDEMGELLKPDYITNRFTKIIKKHNLKPLNFHGLRHSCATLLLSLNYQMKDIQEYLGHSNYELTAKTYAHVDLERKNAMSNELSLVFNF
jgi:integrase